jgi:hypothetical protein
MGLDTGQGKSDFQATDKQAEKEPLREISGKLRYRSGVSTNLTFEKVNEVTWKLTNGEMTNVPACHGFWGGYRTSKAIAWVIDVGVNKPAWFARHKDQCCGPLPLKDAKRAAAAMAKGVCGDYDIGRPIAHLNGMAARLLDAEAASRP